MRCTWRILPGMSATSDAPARPANAEHDELIAKLTGGMTRPTEPFAGSERLRPDGRPRAEFRAELRRIADARNALVVATLLGSIVGVVWLTAAIDSWLAWPLGALIIGAAQLRMFVLHHEAAHRLLFSNRRINDLIGINLLGWLAFGAGTHGYRRVHTQHHRDEFGPGEPDLLLYSFYPINGKSLRRKLVRDATGVSAWRIAKPLITGIAKKGKRVNSLRFYAGQLVMFGAFWLTSQPWLYVVLWVVPYACVYQVLNRLRAIAEHGGMTRSTDRRATTHHVTQGKLTRAWLVPYNVGHHLAHHVDSGIPFRNLGRLTEALIADGYVTDTITWPNYRTLWRTLASVR